MASRRISKRRRGSSMAKATTTIRQSLNYQPRQSDCFAAHQALFNRVVAFYFAVIQAHEAILALTNKEALTALDNLTNATARNASPIMRLPPIAPEDPPICPRAA